MLDQPASPASDAVGVPDAPGRIDRSMDALQYGLAFLAILVAVLLAAIR